MRTLIYGMAAMAAADGTVADIEVTAVGDLCREVFGKEIDEETVRQAVGMIAGHGTAIDIAPGFDPKKIDEPMKKLIVKAMYTIMVCDGVIVTEETELLSEMGAVLGMSDEQFITCVREIGRSIV